MFYIGVMFSLIAIVTGGLLIQKGNPAIGILGIVVGIIGLFLLFMAYSLRKQGKRSDCTFLDYLAWSCIGDIACNVIECGTCEAIECIGADSCA